MCFCGLLDCVVLFLGFLFVDCCFLIGLLVTDLVWFRCCLLFECCSVALCFLVGVLLQFI